MRIAHSLSWCHKITKAPVNEQFLSFEETRDLFNSTKRSWESSKHYRSLLAAISSIRHSLKVTKIVAFACGTMSDCEYEDARRASASQHAMVSVLRECFRSNGQETDTIDCFVQDPSYSNVDKEILKNNEITVIEDPEGFLEVDRFTLVVSCAPDVPVRQIVTDLARPAVMIWDKIHDGEPGEGR